MKIARTLLLLITFSLLTGVASAATYDVGSGYTYSTIASGLAAASSGDYVHVHAGTYIISSPLNIPNGVTLYGDGYSSTTIKASSPLVFSTSAAPASIYLNGKSDIEIYGFTFHGGAASLAAMHAIDNDYRNYCSGIKLTSSSDITIHDCYFTLQYGDSIRASGTNSNVYVYNCIFNTPGHDGLSMYYGSNWRMSNCIVNTFINAGMRIENVVGAEVDHCTFYSDTNSGSGGVELLRAIGTDVRVHHNIFRNMHNSVGDGIFFYSPTFGSVDISNNIMYDIPGAYINNHGFSYTGSGNQLGASPQTESYWVNLGYGYNASATSGGVSSGYTPPPEAGSVYSANGLILSQISPADGTSQGTTNGNITFTWNNVNSTNYNIQVSKESNFASLSRDRETTGTAISLALEDNTTYYWRVRAYSDSSGAWGSFTSAYVLNTTNVVYGNTGVYGIVYETVADNAIAGAVVTLVNDTWSQTLVTNADGFYSFSVPYSPDSTMYYLTCSATQYQTTPYQLPVNFTTEYMEYNIAMTASPEYFAPHNVRFIVTDSFMRERYSASVTAYDSNTNTITASGITGSDGSVTFALKETTPYRMVTEYNNVSYTDYVTPVDSVYYIILGSKDYLPQNQFYNNITISVTKDEINSTSAYINASYADLDSSTTSVMFRLGQTEKNGTFTELQNSSLISTSDNATYNFTVTDYLGQDYVVLIDVVHQDFGNVTKAFAVTFGSNTSPFAMSKELSYLGIFILFIVATQFGRLEHASGSILLCAMAWFMIFIGIFKPLGTALETTIIAGTLAATIYAVVVYINDQRQGVY